MEKILKSMRNFFIIHIFHKLFEDSSCAWISKFLCTNMRLSLIHFPRKFWRATVYLPGFLQDYVKKPLYNSSMTHKGCCIHTRVSSQAAHAPVFSPLLPVYCVNRTAGFLTTQFLSAVHTGSWKSWWASYEMLNEQHGRALHTAKKTRCWSHTKTVDQHFPAAGRLGSSQPGTYHGASWEGSIL